MPKTPPVLALSGNHHFLRERRLRRLLAELESSGKSTDWVDGGEKGALSDALGGGMFFNDPTTYVVTNPQHASQELILDHLESGAGVLILLYRGKVRSNSKYAKFLKKVPNKKFEAPDKYKTTEFAIEFILKEAEEQGYTLGDKLATAIVSKAGTDLGVLSFEIRKAALLAGAEAEALEPPHFRAIAQLAEAEMDPIFRALEARREKLMARALAKYRSTQKDDPTIPVARSLGKRVLLWISAVSLADQGVPPGDAAQLMGQNPWYYQNKVLPKAHRWGLDSLRDLIRVLAEADRSVLSGTLSPWDGLTCGLLRSCKTVST